MKKLYIDYTKAIPTKDVKYHGGGAYSRNIIKKIIEGSVFNDTEIIILWPKGYLPVNSEENEIFNSPKIKIEEINNFDSLEIDDSEVIFYFPLLNIQNWTIAKRLKDRYPSVKIYITIHGLRFFDLKIDYFDSYYNENFFKFVKEIMTYPIKYLGYVYYINKYTEFFDKIFTVSNFSMQQIIRRGKINFISYYYQNINIKKLEINSNNNDEYILFVSGNRSEKNLVRALKAFSIYKKENKNNIFMYITGLNNEFKNLLWKKLSSEEKKYIDKWVKNFEYLEYNDLVEIYKNAKCFLYVSKSEGFGIPIMEAIYYEIPVVASSITSIPEVGGTSVYYVDPYSIKSIYEGITYILEEKNWIKYKELVIRRKAILNDIVREDEKNLVFEILN